jgi:very-short-patch-repair endonuclease
MPKHKQPISDKLKRRSRQLRRDQTDAEKAMWRLLRDRQLNGAKFRRQHMVGSFYYFTLHRPAFSSSSAHRCGFFSM